MNIEKRIDELSKLFKTFVGQMPVSVKTIKAAGSPRQYFRLQSSGKSLLGAYNADVKENEAFFYYSKVFRHNGLRVPEVFAISKNRQFYLLQDLGDQCLFDLLMESKQVFSTEIKSYYQQSLRALVQFQTTNGLNYSMAYPRETFDRRSILWDLNYFKYYFLKMQEIPLDEESLENDFERLTNDLLQIEGSYYMFRDFQARNIMLYQNNTWFIDYQGGRKGPLQYDVLSLLFQAKADIPPTVREELLDYYIKEAKKKISIIPARFKENYYKVLLIRLLQVLGAYGFRGLIERRPHFLESLSYGIKNVKWYITKVDYIREFPELYKQLKAIK